MVQQNLQTTHSHSEQPEITDWLLTKKAKQIYTILLDFSTLVQSL